MIKLSLEQNLDRLTKIIGKSRSKKLKIAFNNYLVSLNSSMRMYIGFIKMFQGINVIPERSKWDVEFRNE